jgi:hypothetical protein
MPLLTCSVCNESRNIKNITYYKVQESLNFNECKRCSKIKHGGCDNDYIHHAIYKRWNIVKNRLRGHPSNKLNYKYYFLKGIQLADEWKDYKNFEQWAIISGFEQGLELDRIDSSKNYSPENCRWVTHKENMQNIKRTPKSEKIKC